MKNEKILLKDYILINHFFYKYIRKNKQLKKLNNIKYMKRRFNYLHKNKKKYKNKKNEW